jgi:hypothetical protein
VGFSLFSGHLLPRCKRFRKMNRRNRAVKKKSPEQLRGLFSPDSKIIESLVITASDIITARVMLRSLLVGNDRTGSRPCEAADQCTFLPSYQSADSRAGKSAAAYIEGLSVPPVNTRTPYRHQAASTVPVISRVGPYLRRCGSHRSSDKRKSYRQQQSHQNCYNKSLKHIISPY